MLFNYSDNQSGNGGFGVGDIITSVVFKDDDWKLCNGQTLKKTDYPKLAFVMNNNSFVNSWNKSPWIIPNYFRINNEYTLVNNTISIVDTVIFGNKIIIALNASTTAGNNVGYIGYQTINNNNLENINTDLSSFTYKKIVASVNKPYIGGIFVCDNNTLAVVGRERFDNN